MAYSGLMLFTSFLWAGSFVVGKILVGHASALVITVLRWLLSVLCLWPLVWLKEGRVTPPRRSLLPLALMGVTGVALFNVFQFWALGKTTAINVGLISTLNPLSIAFFAALFGYEQIRLPQVAAMFLSFLGVVVVISQGNIQQLASLELNSGDLWMVAAVLIWGIYSICAKWAMQWVSPLMATLYSGIFGVGLLAPWAIQDFSIEQADGSFWLAMLYMSLISTVLCMLFWNLGVKKLGATTAGIFLNFNPIFTAIIAYFSIGEQIGLWQIVGSIGVISGCCLFAYFGKNINHKGSLLTCNNLNWPLGKKN